MRTSPLLVLVTVVVMVDSQQEALILDLTIREATQSLVEIFTGEEGVKALISVLLWWLSGRLTEWVFQFL